MDSDWRDKLGEIGDEAESQQEHAIYNQQLDDVNGIQMLVHERGDDKLSQLTAYGLELDEIKAQVEGQAAAAIAAEIQAEAAAAAGVAAGAAAAAAQQPRI